MSEQIKVFHLQAHARGQTVAGLAGRVYEVRKDDGALVREGGVHLDDLTEFKQFARIFRVEDGKAPKVPPPPPVPGGGVTAPAGTTPQGAAKPPTPPSGTPPEEFPAMEALTVDKWLSWAREHGVALSAAEKKTTPKEALYDLIHSKWAEKQAR